MKYLRHQVSWAVSPSPRCTSLTASNVGRLVGRVRTISLEEEDLEDDDLEEVVENENDTAPSAPRRAMLSAVKDPFFVIFRPFRFS